MQTDLRIYNSKETEPTCPAEGALRLDIFYVLPQLVVGSKLQIRNVPGFGKGWCALEVIDVVIFLDEQYEAWQVVTCKPGFMINPHAEKWCNA